MQDDRKLHALAFRDHPVHLSQMVQRPERQGLSKAIGGVYGDQTVVGALSLQQRLVEVLQRPANLVLERIPRDRKTGDRAGDSSAPVECAGPPARHVQKTEMVDSKSFHQPISPTCAFACQIGERRTQMWRSDRRQAQDALGPGRIGQECPRIEPSHAMANDMDGLVAERSFDTLGKLASTKPDARRRRDPRHQHAVAKRRQELWNLTEIPGQGQFAHANSAKAEETMGHYNRSIEAGAHRGVDLASRGKTASSTILA